MNRFLVLSMLLFPVLTHAQSTLPVGTGILKIDLRKNSSIKLYTDFSLGKRMHHIELKENSVGVVELRENGKTPYWFQPEQFYPSYDIFLFILDVCIFLRL